MAIKHKHHIIRNMGESDDKSNLIEFTVNNDWSLL